MARRSEKAVRQEAADWFAKLHGPDRDSAQLHFEAWAKADPAIRLAFVRLEARWDQAALLGNTATGRARHLSRYTPPLQRRVVQLALAAALVAALGSVALISSPESFGFGTAAELAPETPKGEIRVVALSDGSRVTLDTDSAVRIIFSPAERRLELTRGRARFSVAHGTVRPFVVSAAATLVIAHGTVFDVSLLQRAVSVTLLRGAVEVRRPALVRGVPTTVAHLRPGETVAVWDGADLKPRAASTRDSAWTSGMLEFDETPLATVVGQANRYGKAQIRLADSTLGALRVTGAYKASDTEGLAQTLAASLDLELEVLSSGDLMLRQRPKR